MECHLDDIYGHVAAMSVSLNGNPVRVANYDATPATLEPADVPVRLLLPVPLNGESQMMQTLSLTGNRLSVVWTITDLLLLAPVGLGSLKQHAAALIAYQMAFTAAHGALGGFVDPATRLYPLVEDTLLDPGVQEYPRGTFWWGVGVTWRIREIMI